jgi:hypothetical protein
LRSINLFAIDEFGDPVRIEEDSYWEELCDKPDINRLADSTTNYNDLLDDPESLEILLDIMGEKSQWVAFTFNDEKSQLPTDTSTYRDKWETRKEKEKLDTPETREELVKRLKEAMYKIHSSIGNIIEINDLKDRSFKETILDIMKDNKKDSDLKSLLGISAKELMKLIERGKVNSNLLDVYIKLVIKDINNEWGF